MSVWTDFEREVVIDGENKMEEKENVSLDRRLFVGNIGYRTSEKELKDFFQKFGRVNRLHLPKDHYRKLPRGFAFVTFSTAEEAQMCLQAEDERLVLQGRLLRVHMAEQSKRVNTRRYENNNNNHDQQVLVSDSTEVTDLGTAKEMPVFNINIPDELWEKIFSFLPLRDRIRIERVCHRWKKLALRLWKRQKSLDFYNTFRRFESLTDKMLNSILKRCGPILKSLDLSSSPRLLTDYSMQIINKYCPSLEKLDLSGVDATNISIRDLTQDLHTLKWVRLQRCLYIGEKGLWWLLHNNKDLEYLDVTGNIKLTGQCFHMIGPKVKIMVLKECKKLCDVGIEKIKDRCVDLEELYITDCCLLTSKSILTITQVVQLSPFILHCPPVRSI
ncbi:putative RNA-binding protein EEED8.10 isoform X2 [Patella vulgata]|uniref:putative RNA-binding protein EEED8.10 isoform X2 n=1 Tax=Patella vulgata TaxID=6465 RepID=UPI00217F88B5|nr:putative RNA-binding protein EEED8.10 isoform X2 [Patella vulgata]